MLLSNKNQNDNICICTSTYQLYVTNFTKSFYKSSVTCCFHPDDFFGRYCNLNEISLDEISQYYARDRTETMWHLVQRVGLCNSKSTHIVVEYSILCK